MNAAAAAERFTTRERRLVPRLQTPLAVQRYLNALRYNDERPPVGETLRTLRGVLAAREAHCLEAALLAATALEQHGYPPLLLSLESIDRLDHVLFVYRRDGRWGSVARSRDPGLHGRKPVFRTLRDLAQSYFDPYVDKTACIVAYGLYDLRNLGAYDWRLASKNAWKVEQVLIELRHRPLPASPRRYRALKRRYDAFKAEHPRPDDKPIYFARQDRWSELPRAYRAAQRAQRPSS